MPDSTSPKRIVFGGFQHETNTFAPTQADLLAFERGGGWPGLTQGAAIFKAIAASNIPASGFVDAALQAGHTLLPTVWCAASPSAHVTEAAYEQIAGDILAGIEAVLPVDAVYLDLHGAMVTTHFDDGEGELLRRVRALVGADVPVVASLDLHANVTALMLSSADALIAYRTYPHVDMARTGQRTFAMLEQRWARGTRAPMAVHRLPFLVPIVWQCTDIQPAARLYALLEEIEQETGAVLSFATCFPAADFVECSPVIWAYADDQATAELAAGRLTDATNAAEAEFAGILHSPDDAVRYAIEHSRGNTKPIIIADGQDNPGAGANSDTTGMLRALIANDTQRASIGLMVDPAAAAEIHRHRVGDTIRLALGGRSGVTGDAPYEGEFLIEAISDGKIDATGPYYAGFRLDVGPAACLRIGGVRIVVASFKVQMADQSLFRLVGIEPTEEAVLVVKSAVHFRADFAPIAAEIIVGAAPGAMPMRLEQLPWKKLPAGLRLGAKGQPFVPAV
jgi:microcystin degradation protein MlrC